MLIVDAFFFFFCCCCCFLFVLFFVFLFCLFLVEVDVRRLYNCFWIMWIGCGID